MTASTRKLPRLTDQPPKTPATILHEKKDLSANEVGEAQKIMNICKERDEQTQAETCSHDLPSRDNESKLLPIVRQSLYLEVWDDV